MRKIQNFEKKSEIEKKKIEKNFFWKNPHFQKNSRNRKKKFLEKYTFSKKMKIKKIWGYNFFFGDIYRDFLRNSKNLGISRHK